MCVLSTCAVCLSVAAVNQAVKEYKVTQTLRVLSLPELQLQGLISNCAADYQKELSALITHRTHTGNSDQSDTQRSLHLTCSYTHIQLSVICLCAGDNGSPWVRVRLEDGSLYYFHLNRLDGNWEKPSGFVHNSLFIDRQEIQVRHI